MSDLGGKTWWGKENKAVCRAGDELVYFRNRWYDASVGSFATPDPLGYKDSATLYPFCGDDPVNCSDPDGMARRTKNGGWNWMGNLGDVVHVTGFWSGALSATLDTAGNTVSDLLGLDIVADASFVAGDSGRSAKERSIAAAKGIAVAALDIAGGQILKGAGGLLAKVPGVAGVAERFAASRVATAVARAASKEIASLTIVDEAVAAVRSSAVGRFLRRDVQTFMPGGVSPASLKGLLDDAAYIHSGLASAAAGIHEQNNIDIAY